jgi:hypothetical protein
LLPTLRPGPRQISHRVEETASGDKIERDIRGWDRRSRPSQSETQIETAARRTQTHVKDNRFQSPPPPSSLNHSFNNPWSAPSKLPFPPNPPAPSPSTAACIKPLIPSKSLSRGRMTMTPELKQSGQPVSAHAERTCGFVDSKRCERGRRGRTSASR